MNGAGTPSISNDSVVLTVTDVEPNQPGLFFRGYNAANAGLGITLGDGLQCAGGNLVRLGVAISDDIGSAVSSPGLLTGLAAGDVRRFQYRYRNPGGTPCGSAFNLTIGFEITTRL